MSEKSKTDSLKWEEKCEAIKQQDGHTCVMCGAKDKDKLKLQVHHKRYYFNRKKWDYKDEELETLCIDCHFYKHNFEGVPIYDEEGNFVANSDECFKCKGKGYIDKYKNNMKGICFKCKGVGYDRRIPLRAFLKYKEIQSIKEFFENRKVR